MKPRYPSADTRIRGMSLADAYHAVGVAESMWLRVASDTATEEEFQIAHDALLERHARKNGPHGPRYTRRFERAYAALIEDAARRGFQVHDQ